MTSAPTNPSDAEWILPKGTEISIIAATAVSKERFAFALSLGGANYDEFGDQCRFYRYLSGDWTSVEVGHLITDMIPYAAAEGSVPGLALLSQQGAVIYLGDVGFSQQIEEAGYSEGRNAPKRYGATTRIRQIGGKLYVCGDGGQLYSFNQQWEDAAALRNTPVADPQDSVDCEGRLLGRPPFRFTDVGSPNGSDLYACGIMHPYNGVMFAKLSGGAWRQIPLKPNCEGLLTIYAETGGNVWVGGHDSFVMRGNARDGFQEVACEQKGVPIESIVRFKGRLYAGGSLGLFQLGDDNFTPVRTARPASIKPGVGPLPYDDCHLLQVVDDTLFMFGYQSIQTFDGTAWRAIEIPTLVAR